MIEENSGAIIHICNRRDWEAALKTGTYQADSLASSGFIHCSLPSQILTVANHYFQGQKDLILLWIDPHRLHAEVRWETAETGIFPHVYGPINVDAITAVLDFPPDKDGIFRSVPGVISE
jgi:uncharacterized protein (DUF952 family)